MRVRTLSGFVIALAITAIASVFGFSAQAGPVMTQAKDVCNATLIQFVDTPLTVTFDASGSYRVSLTPAQSLSVGNCRHFYFMIGQSSVTGYTVIMGKFTNGTLTQQVMTGSALGKIQSLEVKGPEIVFDLQGPPKKKENIQMWFYLTPT